MAEIEKRSEKINKQFLFLNYNKYVSTRSNDVILYIGSEHIRRELKVFLRSSLLWFIIYYLSTETLWGFTG